MTVKYREVKRKANVGERIRIVNTADHRYKNGDEFTVSRSESAGIFVPHHRGNSNGCAGVFHSEYVVLEPIEPAVPAQLNFPDAIALFMHENAAAVRKYLDEIAPETAPGVSIDSSGGLTANNVTVSKQLTRAGVIEKAKADVAELIRIGQDVAERLTESDEFYASFFTADFHINREKRVVTALVSYTDSSGRITEGNVAKGIARCSQGDVFHAEIGKAIALRKALGLVVPDEYLNAPQPENAAPGAVIRKIGGAAVGDKRVISNKRRYGNDSYSFTNGLSASVYNCEIIDDTDVDYSAAGSEVAA
ncbi:hypothetical protein ACFQ3Y_24895 [Paenibacillus motobuensis]|uniref:hypothetical protein n=1 Tax=Paenibacillus motobuensis TaxID=295324 RepID=UPI003644825F